MRIWTIQPEAVYEALKEQKVLYTDISKSSLYHMEDIGVTDNPLQKGYGWLAKRMEEKIGKPEGASYPWWAWYKRHGKCKKPDLREAGYAEKGERCVCLELEVPDSEVVLSDFDLWWFCISDCWFSGAADDDGLDRLDSWFRSLDKGTQERLKLESWETVFDIEPDQYGRGSWVQATFWELRLADVKKAVYFTAR